MPIKCKYCGAPILNGGKKWCSDKCRSANWQKSHPEIANIRVKRWRNKNPKWFIPYNHLKNLALKIEVLSHYGGKCACCGETELSFLELDHINGRGNEHRRNLGGGNHFFHNLKKYGYPEGLQVLCANCHCSKHFLGECVHKKDENEKA